ncbi:MAG: hypothetical protein GXO89_00430 [Chlorobi bacterium]|nr:hypothetical protein [Chlorobiota bacterium]
MTNKPFLKNVTGHIVDNYGNSIGEICIVLPNRRAGLFLKKHLSNSLQKTIWEPAVYSIEDFVVEMSGLKTIDPVFLLFELYEVHREVEGANAQDFDQFIKWGNVLLHDFNDVDMYLADAGQVFGFLSDAKAIEKWNPDGKALTDFELKYLRFFSSLKTYYIQLKERLLKKNQVYQGLAYRKLADEIDKVSVSLPWGKVVFAGFNALTTAEEKIIKTLLDAKKADLLWDADKYYVENEAQEAGLFLRRLKNSLKLENLKWMGDNFGSGKKKIEIIGVPQNVGQAKVAAKILKDYSETEESISQTAVVLNDEAMMLPVLNSIPSEIKSFNLTMGLPLDQSPLFSLYEAFFNLHENALRFDKTGGKQLRYYFRDLLNISEHIYLKSFIARGNGGTNEKPVVEKLKSQNKIFYWPHELSELFASLPKKAKEGFISLFEPWGDNPRKALDNLIAITVFMKDIETGKENNEKPNSSDSLKIEYLFHYSKVLKRMEKLLTGFPYLNTVRSLQQLFHQVVGVLTISFYGEPLTGLQIMGMLETRTLDFENLIMLSVNEDLIPSGKSANSFVPFDIRMQHGLPTYKDRNAIFAYHFYRLLQRSKNIHLLYNTEVGDLGGGDKSRFIAQLLVELPKYNPEIEVVERILTGIPAKNDNEVPIVVPKDEAIFGKLLKHAGNGFSPSALNIFRNCSLRFYFQYVAKLREREEVEETIEAATLGSVVHEVLQKLYTPFIGKNVVVQDVKKMFPKIAALVRKSFGDKYEGGELDYGKNLLVVKVAEMFVTNFLHGEMAMLQKDKPELHIVSLEEMYLGELEIKLENSDVTYPVKFKGNCDRIDILDGITRVIDYKTGNVKTYDLTLKEWEMLDEGIKRDKVFQVLFYAFVFSKSQSNPTSLIKAGIISFRNLSFGFMAVKTPEGDMIDQDILNEFEIVLSEITKELLERSIPFSQTENPDNCSYCPFVGICGR